METHKHFYELLGNKIKELRLENKPQNIFNCDETGFLCHRGCKKFLLEETNVHALSLVLFKNEKGLLLKSKRISKVYGVQKVKRDI